MGSENAEIKNETSTTQQYTQENPTAYMGALEPYFELVQNEYNQERNKKQGLESRSGIVLSVVAAIIAVIFDKITIKDIFPLMIANLTFLSLFKILSGLCIYISLFVCMFFALKTIFTSSYAAYDISKVSSSSLGNQKNKEMGNIIMTYRFIILEHRNINEKKAYCLAKSIISIAVCTISICLYINL